MKRILILGMAMLGLLSACEKGGGETPVPPEPPVVQKLPVNISLTVATKITDNAYEEGDETGLYMAYSSGLNASGNHINNAKYSYKGGNWSTASQYYWKDNSTAADFYCYHPYLSVADAGAVDFAVKADQSQKADYGLSDFTWGKKTAVAPTQNKISIATSHLMSKVLIYLKAGKGFTQEELDKAVKTLTIKNVKTACKISLADGSLTLSGNAGDVVPAWEKDHYQALIVPQTVSGELPLISATIDGVEYSAAYNMEFTSKSQHTLTVTVDKSSFGMDLTIDQWIVDDTIHDIVIK